jgi:hypothetical protein
MSPSAVRGHRSVWALAPIRVRREPETTVLYRVLAAHLYTFVQRTAGDEQRARTAPLRRPRAARVPALRHPGARVGCHGPLEGKVLEIVRYGKSHLVVRNPDSLTMRIPRAWTDADRVAPPPKIEPDTQLTFASLRDFLRLVDALGDRA